MRNQIIEEAEEYKRSFYEKRKLNCESNKTSNREREKVQVAANLIVSLYGRKWDGLWLSYIILYSYLNTTRTRIATLTSYLRQVLDVIFCAALPDQPREVPQRS
jgi:hypothetical protein